MSDEPKRRSRKWGWIGWALFALLIVYPLSFGPAFWLCAKTKSPWALLLLGVAYTPLIEVCERSPALKSAERSYLEWWLRMGLSREHETAMNSRAHRLFVQPRGFLCKRAFSCKATRDAIECPGPYAPPQIAEHDRRRTPHFTDTTAVGTIAP